MPFASIYPNIGYEPVKSFNPVILTGSLPNVLVVCADSLYKSVIEVIEAAKKNDKKQSLHGYEWNAQAPDVHKQLEGLGLIISGAGPAELGWFRQAEVKKWGGVGRKDDIEP